MCALNVECVCYYPYIFQCQSKINVYFRIYVLLERNRIFLEYVKILTVRYSFGSVFDSVSSSRHAILTYIRVWRIAGKWFIRWIIIHIMRHYRLIMKYIRGSLGAITPTPYRWVVQIHRQAFCLQPNKHH